MVDGTPPKRSRTEEAGGGSCLSLGHPFEEAGSSLSISVRQRCVGDPPLWVVGRPERGSEAVGIAAEFKGVTEKGSTHHGSDCSQGDHLP